MASRSRGKKKGRTSRKPNQQQIRAALLAELTHTIRSLHEYDRAVSRQGGGVKAAAMTSGSAGTVFIGFTKKSGPSFVRINMRDNNFPALLPDNVDGKSDARHKGDRLEATVEVNGNPGEMAVITIKNAIPDTIKLAVPPGQTGEIGTFPLLVL